MLTPSQRGGCSGDEFAPATPVPSETARESTSPSRPPDRDLAAQAKVAAK
ncbi:hypothetical protein [Bradyrhizobium erythrophlei]|jgi:hypothetical protein|uniref:Uncharacterized protein n=1 Tax=Bradyrhizobium erythrophlei TaxID=1437360 RepID=A0A1M5YST0_9BRAD|nr:hypothetical protein [Bradyrhizobium erythrophlei]SHI14884.1 hypothetical protein SAMN05443248_8714 [Bradyrhizobium erythrophlei]